MKLKYTGKLKGIYKNQGDLNIEVELDTQAETMRLNVGGKNLKDKVLRKNKNGVPKIWEFSQQQGDDEVEEIFDLWMYYQLGVPDYVYLFKDIKKTKDGKPSKLIPIDKMKGIPSTSIQKLSDTLQKAMGLLGMDEMTMRQNKDVEKEVENSYNEAVKQYSKTGGAEVKKEKTSKPMSKEDQFKVLCQDIIDKKKEVDKLIKEYTAEQLLVIVDNIGKEAISKKYGTEASKKLFKYCGIK